MAPQQHPSAKFGSSSPSDLPQHSSSSTAPESQRIKERARERIRVLRHPYDKKNFLPPKKMAKPLHPATVHFPIAFLILAYTLDIFSFLHLSFLAPYLPTTSESARLSQYLLALGLLSAIPAVFSGGQQAFLLISKSGLHDERGSLRPKVKALFTHAILSDVVMAATAYIWWLKSKGKTASWMAPVEGLLLAGIVVVGGIGGTLTYGFGVGMSVGKATKGKKDT